VSCSNRAEPKRTYWSTIGRR